MKISILEKHQQAKGQFNNGEILENKPIGFPQEGGHKAYSNLFYWSHAWSDNGSLIGEHPHKGFEILSIVLEGEIEHFDNMNNKWIPLKKGDVQIIRAGSGIYHAERLKAGTHMFQIWFDPDLTKTLDHQPSYDDYASGEFPVHETDGMTAKWIAGEGTPLHMETPGISIREITMQSGDQIIKLEEETIASLYLISGNLKIDDREMQPDDFAIISETTEINLSAGENAWLMLITSPATLDYTPYLELFRK
ncbi:MAG: pirin family protein [Bacteroidales bacterium]